MSNSDDADEQILNHGKFRALLDLCPTTWDKDLGKHLETAARNAQYISKIAQNDLLACMKETTQSQIVNNVENHAEVNGALFYGMQGDKVRDIKNWEQLGVVIRFIKKHKPVEKLIEFINSEEATGQAICEKLLQGLKLSPAKTSKLTDSDTDTLKERLLSRSA